MDRQHARGAALNALPARRALAAVAVALLLGLAWQFGRLSARGPVVEGPDGAADASGSASGASVAEDDPRAVALERVAAERDVALAAAARLEARLGEAERAAEAAAAELALYRRIESGAVTDGLSVASVGVVGAGTPGAELAVTLVQSRGRHRVTGTLAARVLDGAGDGAAVGEAPAKFDLRFFQTLRLPLDPAAAALAGAGPDGSARVELDVRPAGDRHERFVEILPLDPIVAERSGE